MTIVLVIDVFTTHNNGTTISAFRFANALKERGHTVRVVAHGDPLDNGIDPVSGFEMFFVPELIIPFVTKKAHEQEALWAKPDVPTLEKAIAGADIVHIYQPFPLGSGAIKVARKLGVPTLGAFHCQPENITYNLGLGWFPPVAHLVYLLLYLLFFRHFTHLHCPSKFIAAQLRKHGYKAWLHVISNGVHPDFKPAEADKVIAKDGVFKVLMVGRLSPEKRQDVLIRAVMQSKFSDKIQLIFAGTGPWDKKLKKMGGKLPIAPKFCFLAKNELIELMRESDLYVHASDIEIEGISCIEAISCGLVPIISDSARSAAGQFTLEPKSLFKSGSPASLAERIDYWLSNPDQLPSVGKSYTEYAREFSLERTIKKIEGVYSEIIHSANTAKNPYQSGRIFKTFSRLFYSGIATPLLFLWSRIYMGVRVEGAKNFRGLKGALTVCNHVHMMDSALVALAMFPRKTVFTTLPMNLNTLWPGKIVRLLGGVAVPKSAAELKIFFDEMELLLRKGRIVHFFPEGELSPYDNHLREFKRGAFRLAAQARVPIVPMSISFHEPKWPRKLIRKKPVMTLHIAKPIYPVNMNSRSDAEQRMGVVKVTMESMLSTTKSSIVAR